VKTHEFDPGYSGQSTECNHLVLRDGVGDECGRARNHSIHGYENPLEHMWLRDVRNHPEGEVRLYVDDKLVSGTFAFQVTSSIDEMIGD